MKLYLHPASPYCRKVLIAAHMLGVTLETEFVDIAAGGAKTPEFLALNPNGLVPTLQDGDFCLWESNAIVQYLADRAAPGSVAPSDPRGRAEVLRWQFWEATRWAPACSILVYENMLKPMMGWGETDAAEVLRGEEKFHAAAPVLDGHLASRPWLVGDGPTLAEASLAPTLMYWEEGRYPVAAYGHLLAWFERVRALPAWAATAPRAE